MKKGSRAIKSGLRCFSCCYPYHDDKICINCEFSTSGIKRIQELRRATPFKHINRSLSQFKTIKMAHIKNQEQARKAKKQWNKKQNKTNKKTNTFALRSSPWNPLIPSLKGVWVTNKNIKFGYTSLRSGKDKKELYNLPFASV